MAERAINVQERKRRASMPILYTTVTIPVVNSEMRHFYINREIIMGVLEKDSLATKILFEKFGDGATFEMDSTFLKSLQESMIFHSQQVFLNEKNDQLDRRSLWTSFDDLLRYVLNTDSTIDSEDQPEPLSDPFRM